MRGRERIRVEDLTARRALARVKTAVPRREPDLLEMTFGNRLFRCRRRCRRARCARWSAGRERGNDEERYARPATRAFRTSYPALYVIKVYRQGAKNAKEGLSRPRRKRTSVLSVVKLPSHFNRNERRRG